MRNKREYLNLIIIAMLSVMMTVTGIAPSFHVFAEETAAEEASQTSAETEEAAPASEKEAAEEAPAPEPAAEEPAAAEKHAEQRVSDDGIQSIEEERVPAQAMSPGASVMEGISETGTAAADPDKNADKTEDEDKYPAQNFSATTADLDISVSASAGVFPEGTRMKARAVSAAEVIEASQRIAGEGAEVVDAAAADITFHCGGREIQPEGSVRVKLHAKREIAGDVHEAVTLSGSGKASAVSGASSDSASFKTDHFTVYGIIGEEYEDDVEKHARCTYRFYIGPSEDDFITEVIVRAGETLEVPDSPAGSTKEPFVGWFDSGGREILDGETAAAGSDGRDRTIKVYARYGEKFTVTCYADPERAAVLDASAEEAGADVVLMTAEEAAAKGLRTPEGASFAGWKKAGAAGGDIIAKIENIGEDWELIPVFTEGHRVIFDTGRRELSVADQTVADGEKVTEPGELKEGDTHHGHVFCGWYVKITAVPDGDSFDEGDRFDFDKALTETDDREIQLYAGWKSSQVKVHVDVYLENAHAHQDGFSHAASEIMNVTPGQAVPVADILAEYPADRYEWFHRRGTGAIDGESEGCFMEVISGGHTVKFNARGECVEGDAGRATAEADGTTAVKVYYCRDSYYMDFRFCNREGSRIVHDETGAGGNSLEGKKLNSYALSNHAPEGYGAGDPEFSLPDRTEITAKYGEWLHECTHITNTAYAGMFDAFMAKEGWFFERLDFNGKGETVFNESNRNSPVKPNKNIGDGGTLNILIYLKGGQMLYTFREVYYDRSVTAEQINSGAVSPDRYGETFSANYVSDNTRRHRHTWTIGTGKDGFKLAAVTNYSEVKLGDVFFRPEELTEPLSEGTTYTFCWKNGALGQGEPEMIYLHYVPADHTITFRQTRNGKVRGFAPDAGSAVADRIITVFAGEKLTGADSVLTGEKEVPSGGGWDSLKDVNGVTYAAKDGWRGEGAYSFLPDVMPARDLVFYREWDAQDVRVVFHPENGEPETEQICRISDTSRVTRINNPKRAGHAFGGWYMKPGGESSENNEAWDFDVRLNASNTERLVSAEDGKIHIYAGWISDGLYRVVYDLNGGTASEELAQQLAGGMDRQAYREGSDATVRGAARPSDDMRKDGCVFTGWEMGRAESGELLRDGGCFAAGPANDKKDGAEDFTITLVAKYERKDPKTALTYHSNYPSGEDIEKSFDGMIRNGKFVIIAPDSDALGFGKRYTAADGTEYEFACWTNAEGERTFSGEPVRDYFRAGEFAAAGMKENHLYAVWRAVAGAVGSDEPPADAAGTDKGHPSVFQAVLGDYEDDSETTEKAAKGMSEVMPHGIGTGDGAMLKAWAGIMAAAVLLSAVILIARRRRSDR